MNNEEMDFTDAEMLRKKAEEQLKEKQTKTPDAEFDVKKLLHELQVHQIELEMQNEELREAYVTAETALKKYTMLYDFSPMGYFTLNYDGSICDLNFTGADMLGERRFGLVNSNFKLFITEDSLFEFNNFLNNAYKNNSKESCEVKLASKQGTPCPVYMEGIVTREDQKCLLSVTDISGLKR